jgi:hypothetical protein
MERVSENQIDPVAVNRAYSSQWEDLPDSTILPTVPMKRYRGGRRGQVPHVGSVSTPLHFSHDPCPFTTPTLVNSGALRSKAVVGIKLGWNFAIASTAYKQPGAKAKKLKLQQLLEREKELRTSGYKLKKSKTKKDKQDKKKKKHAIKEES